MNYSRLITNIIVAIFAILCVDGCAYRDPGVELPHGYQVAAISAKSPCRLSYSSSRDERSYSNWSASKTYDDGKLDSYDLFNPDSSELLQFDSETKWREAIAEKNANPKGMVADLMNVTGYSTNNTHLIGYSDGYFLLTYANHKLQTWDDAEPWMNAVEKETTLNPRSLYDPKSPFVQSRHWGFYLFYVGLLGYAIFDSREKKKATKNVGRALPDD